MLPERLLEHGLAFYFGGNQLHTLSLGCLHQHCIITCVSMSIHHRWAMGKGYGAFLIKRPELVADMVRQARSQSGVPISIKIRVHEDLRETVQLVRRAEHAGVSWITVHGRTVKQRGEPANMEAIRLVLSHYFFPEENSMSWLTQLQTN